MQLSSECLRRARRENVERLARALGVDLPRPTPDTTVYKQRLVNAVMHEIRTQAEDELFQRLLSV